MVHMCCLPQAHLTVLHHISRTPHYQIIISKYCLVVPQGSLYPTLAAMNTEQTATVPTVICTLCNRVITNMEKYMQDAEKVHGSNDNYFNAMTRSTNKSPVPDDSISKPIVLNQDQKDTVKKYQQVKQPM